MRVCVFGAGAVGGYLAAMLLRAGRHEVAVVARGAQRTAIAAQGLTLCSEGASFTVRPHAIVEQAAVLAPQDLVFVTTKAHAQPAAAADIAGLLGPGSVAVFVCNGIPWWWNYRGEGGEGGEGGAGQPLPLLDPEAALWTQVQPQRAIGCVVYSANEVLRPGVVRHMANNRWLLGEPDGSRSPRLAAVMALLCEVGLHAEATDDLRYDIWHKLLRNAPLNSVCALTRLPVGALAADPQLVALCHAVIDEVAAVAAAHGADVSAHVAAAKAAPEQGGAVQGSAAGTPIRPSMLQDVLSGRPMELDPILGQVQAFARQAGLPCPAMDMLLPLLRGLERSAS